MQKMRLGPVDRALQARNRGSQMSYRDLRKAEEQLVEAEARLAKRGALPRRHLARRSHDLQQFDAWKAPISLAWRRGDVGYDGQVLADLAYGAADPSVKPGHNRQITPEEHQLVLDHMKIVRKWAGRYARKTRGTVYNDLVALGQDVLYQQLSRWDRTKGFTFGAFVGQRVRGAMVNYLERDRDRKNLSIGGTPSDPQPGDDDLGQAHGWAREAWKSEADEKRYRGKKPKPGPSSYAAAASWRERSPDRNYFEREPGVSLAEAVERALEALTEKQREVYRARVLEHPPVEVSVLAKRMGVIERRIRALEARAREIVSDRLKEIGK
jgi:RNA polymerase sigma factor (sigma-70 family)